jgi:hypothetical protein
MSTTCEQCRKPFGQSHFAIIKYDQNNVATSTVSVCSLLCLAQFAYAACVNAGIKGVFVAQNTFARVKAALFGGGS